MGDKPSIITVVSKMKTIHSLMSQQREFARRGDWISTDDLRTVKNIALDVVEMSEEIRKMLLERVGEA